MSTKKTEVPVLHHYQIADGVVAFSSTRQGGVSEGSYVAFNVNHYCGDHPAHIAENKQRLCKQLGIDESHLVYPHQTHQTEVRVIDEAFLSLSDEDRQPLLEGIDAVMTNLQGVCIAVSTADCIPVLLYDEAHHAIAAVHAGWRGTVARIVEKAIAAMQHTYQTNPHQLKAVIGPGISLKNFEVGDEVYEEFEKNDFAMSQIAARYPKNPQAAQSMVHSKSSNCEISWHLNLPRCNQMQLEGEGVQTENIHMSNICTYDHVDTFFSARRLGINSGRILTGILMLNS